MKKFILKFFIFLLPIILAGYFVDLIISENLRKSNSYAEKEFPTWNAIIEGRLDANILVYGSSRAWVHFDPKIIEDSLKQPVFNLGIDGHTFNMQYLRHILSLKNNPNPKLIIHSIDASTLQKGTLYNPDQFLPFMLWNNIFYEYMSKYKGYSYFDFKIPLIRYYGKFAAIKESIKMIVFPQNNLNKRIRGYQGQDKTWNNDFNNAKKTMNKFIVKNDDSTIVLFDKYLRECKEQNIEVILVYSPIYIEGQKFIENQEQIINIYKKFAEKYGFSFMDFTKDEICYEKKYFYNSIHMNKTGAELFTRKLCNQIKSMSAQRVWKKKI